MEEKKLNNWFCGLTVRQKEYIATNILLSVGQDPISAQYPNCTTIWLSASTDRKSMIYDQCTDRQGLWIAN